MTAAQTRTWRAWFQIAYNDAQGSYDRRADPEVTLDADDFAKRGYTAGYDAAEAEQKR